MPRGDNNKGNPRANAPVCSGHTKAGNPCKNPAMPNGKCYVHGGPTPSGVGSVNLKHGRYSKSLIANLRGSYDAELNDPKLVELADEIAVARAYVMEIMESGESGIRWRHVEEAFRELEGAIRENRPADVVPALARMRGVVKQGRRDWAHRAEVMQRFEALRRLVDSEHKYRIDERLAISWEQMAVTLSAVVDVVSRHVDREQMSAIDRELEQIIADASGGAEGDAQAH